MISRAAKLITKIGVDKKQYLALIDANCQYSISELKYQITDLTTAIQILLGNPEALSEPTSEESEVIPEPKARKAPSKKKQ
jgi:hypothetical protein